MSPADAVAMDLADRRSRLASRGLSGEPTNSDKSPMTTKRSDLPASIYTSRATMLHTTMKGNGIYVRRRGRAGPFVGHVSER